MRVMQGTFPIAPDLYASCDGTELGVLLPLSQRARAPGGCGRGGGRDLGAVVVRVSRAAAGARAALCGAAAAAAAALRAAHAAWERAPPGGLASEAQARHLILPYALTIIHSSGYLR